MADGASLSSRTGGLLLAGGRSCRFGAEKAVARFGDAVMMDAVLKRFAPLAAVAVSARSDSAAAAHARALGLELVHDNIAGPAGPLAGILAGLKWVRRRGACFLAIAPCDAPLLPTDLFWRLLCALGDAPAAFAVTSEGEHPLCAVWRVALLPCLQQALAEGEHPSVRSLLAEIGAARVAFADARAFANANTRAALAALERPA